MATPKKHQRTIRIDGSAYDAIKLYCKDNAMCITKWIEIHLKKALGCHRHNNKVRKDMDRKLPITVMDKKIKEIEDATGKVVTSIWLKPDNTISKYTLGDEINKKSTEQKPIE